MELYSYVWPHLRPGRYRVKTPSRHHRRRLGSGTSCRPLQHLEVTAPAVRDARSRGVRRVPPPNASGPFAGRLAQVVLRRPPLPWDRSASPAEPWLALVVLAEGEANFIPDLPAPEATRRPRPDRHPRRRPGGDGGVPQKVIDRRVPGTRRDRPAHPRPQGRREEHRVRGRGRLGIGGARTACRSPGRPTAPTSSRLRRPTRRAARRRPGTEGSRREDGVFDGRTPVVARESGTLHRWTESARRLRSAAAVTGGRLTPARGRPARTRAVLVGDARAGADVAPSASGRSGTSAGTFVRHDIDFVAARGELPGIDLRALLSASPSWRHWEFDLLRDAGDFAGYMNHLDVGLFGDRRRSHDPAGAVVPVTPTGTPEHRPHQPPRRHRERLVPGPFTPSKITREPAGKPYHVADQARRIGPDGREDLSLRGRRSRSAGCSRCPTRSSWRHCAVWAREEFAIRRQDDVILPSSATCRLRCRSTSTSRRLAQRRPAHAGGHRRRPAHRARRGVADPRGAARSFQPVRHRGARHRARAGAQIVAATLGTDVSTSPVDSAIADPGLRTFDELLGATAELGALHDHLAAAVDDVRVPRPSNSTPRGRRDAAGRSSTGCSEGARDREDATRGRSRAVRGSSSARRSCCKAPWPGADARCPQTPRRPRRSATGSARLRRAQAGALRIHSCPTTACYGPRRSASSTSTATGPTRGRRRHRRRRVRHAGPAALQQRHEAVRAAVDDAERDQRPGGEPSPRPARPRSAGFLLRSRRCPAWPGPARARFRRTAASSLILLRMERLPRRCCWCSSTTSPTGWRSRSPGKGSSSACGQRATGEPAGCWWLDVRDPATGVEACRRKSAAGPVPPRDPQASSTSPSCAASSPTK